MLFPSICVENFFKNPRDIVNFSKKLNFTKDPLGRWPGTRSDYLHLINNDFFVYVITKIISILYPIEYKNMNWIAESYFQKVSGDSNTGEGWIHQDIEREITSIIYLSEHENCGTSIYKKNKEHIFPKYNENLKIKQEYYFNNKKFDVTYFNGLKNNNFNYKKIVDFNSIFNNCVIFDSSNYHAANNFYDKNIKEDRLTLVTFFSSLKHNNLKYSISELNRV